MQASSILYPAIAMFSLTMFCLFRLGYLRHKAIKAREVRASFYRTYNEGTQPAYLHVMSRHVQNHFEVPPLFHIAVVLTYVTGNVTDGMVAVAWLFVLARGVHTFIHLTTNNVNQRFFCFGFSLIFLCVLWGNLFFTLVST